MALRGRDYEGALEMYKHLEKLHNAALKKGISNLEMPPAPNEEQRTPY